MPKKALKKTVAPVSAQKPALQPLQPAEKYGTHALVTPAELARHLGVSRQRASALLYARRVAGPKCFPRAADGRWWVTLPLKVLPGTRGPTAGPTLAFRSPRLSLVPVAREVAQALA